MILHPITVWKYYEAPDPLKISTNGGDEDWLAEVPPGYDYVPWLESGSRFGCCDVEIHDHPARTGWTIHIGCHA
jgi:hypothetical protein